MSVDTMCRVCLVNNLNLYDVGNELQTAYERITREKYNKVGFPLTMCCICLSVLQKCHRFMETARDTNRLLKQWHIHRIKKIVVKPLSIYSMTKVEVTYMGSDIVSADEVKMEVLEDDSQSDYIEYDTDVLIEKLEADEQTDSDFVLDSSNSNLGGEVSNNDRHTDSFFNNNVDFAKIDNSNVDVHTMKINLHENDSQMYEDMEVIEVKQEIETNDEIMKFLSTNEAPGDLNTIIKIEQIDEDSDIFSEEKSYFNEPSSLKVNQKTKSKNKKLYICDICNVSCTSLSRLRRHIDKKHATKIIKKLENKIFSCNECTYKCNSKRSFLIHSKFHETVSLPRDCQKDKTFDHSLNTFLTTSSGTNNEPTKICGDRQSIKRNCLKTSGEPEVLNCNICDYKSVKTNNFNRHLKSHSAEKPFSCNSCNVKCTTKTGLKLHMRTHTGEKPFSCDFCERRCVTSSDLTKHLRIHTGEKPYACEICGHKCTRLYHLKLHMKRHMK